MVGSSDHDEKKLPPKVMRYLTTTAEMKVLNNVLRG